MDTIETNQTAFIKQLKRNNSENKASKKIIVYAHIDIEDSRSSMGVPCDLFYNLELKVVFPRLMTGMFPRGADFDVGAKMSLLGYNYC